MRLHVSTSENDVLSNSETPMEEENWNDDDTEGYSEIDPVFLTMQSSLKEQQEKKSKKVFLYWGIVAAVIAVIVLVRIFFITPVSVFGDSMNPTFESGELLLAKVSRIVDEIHHGDVVVVRNAATGGKSFIKRVEGLPGDTIQILNGKLIRNGEEIDEGFDDMEQAGVYKDASKLGDDEYFVLGDNRNGSNDSRFVGTFHRSEIECVVICKLWQTHLF